MPDTIHDPFRVTLLGTGAPPPSLERFGPSTLVEVGAQKFIFDAGRGAMQRLHQLGIPFCDITGMYLTHHHSDHVVGFPDLWLTGWIGRPWGKRSTPLDVWGPQGTRQMMEHLPQAFAVDLRVRSRSYPPEGAKLVPHEIKEGVLFDQDGIQVSAFEVDHGGEELPAFGYRIDYRNHAAVLSGDTTFNENLIEHAQGANLLVHEVTAVAGSAAEPKLAVYNHLLLFGSATAGDLIPATRQKYAGPLMVGVDLLQIDVGQNVQAKPFENASRR